MAETPKNKVTEVVELKDRVIFKNRDPSKAIPPLYGALVKNEQDVQLLERLAFMARREGNSN